MAKNRYICYVALSISIIALLSSCKSSDTPPNIDDVSLLFYTNHSSIEIVVNYMIGTGYTDIHIQNSSGRIWADFEYAQIYDEPCLYALSELLDSGLYKGIYKLEDTIYLQQWEGISDIGCGIAYSVDPRKPPVVQYATKLVSISEDGWFYYVDDYNEWRNQQG